MKKMKHILLGLISTFTLMGCGADFLDTAPRNAVSSSNIWTSSILAEQAVSTILLSAGIVPVMPIMPNVYGMPILPLWILT